MLILALCVSCQVLFITQVMEEANVYLERFWAVKGREKKLAFAARMLQLYKDERFVPVWWPTSGVENAWVIVSSQRKKSS